MKVIKRSFNQNYLIKKPTVGALIFTIFIWCFALLYRPFEFDYNTRFHFSISLLLFGLGGSLSYIGFIYLTKSLFPKFYSTKNWTFLKEILIIVLSLIIIGITVYFLGYLINLNTSPVSISGLLDALKMIFLMGIIPFGALLIKNIGNPFISTYDVAEETGQFSNSIVEIQSALKEKLQISVENLVYIISNGNYVDFYLTEDDKIIRKTLRNSLNDIEKQLADFPFCIRTHRAYMVNINFLINKKGNAQGYRLTLEGVNEEIPVSRKKITEFDAAYKISKVK